MPIGWPFSVAVAPSWSAQPIARSRACSCCARSCWCLVRSRPPGASCTSVASCARGCALPVLVNLPDARGCAACADARAGEKTGGIEGVPAACLRRASSPSWSPRWRRACAREPRPPPPGASRWRASARAESCLKARPTRPSSTNGRASRRGGSSPCAPGPQTRPLVAPPPPSPWPADSATASARPWPTSSTPSGTVSMMPSPSRKRAASPPPVPSCPRESSPRFPSSES